MVLVNAHLLPNKYGEGLVLLPCGSLEMEAIVEARWRALTKGKVHSHQVSTEKIEATSFKWTQALDNVHFVIN